MTLSAAEVDRLKKAPSADGVLPLFLNRWSPRSFADREVSPADLARIFEAVRWTASSYNEQPWRFFVGKRNSQAHRKIFDLLTPHNQAWAGRAPVLILGVAKTKFTHNDTPNRVALYDLGAAAALLSLEAAALGLYTHQMAGFDTEAALTTFHLPPGEYVAGAVIALGYQGEPAVLDNQQMLAQEQSPRTRKNLSEFVWSDLNQPAELG